MSAPSAEEREFVERLGQFFTMLGATRTMGRIYGWLLLRDPDHQSITELSAGLGASKASISTVARQLQEAQIVERAPVPGSREHHYRLTPGGWAQILRSRLGRLGVGVAAAEYGLSVVGDDRPVTRERLREMRDFFAFVEQEFGDELLRRWEAFRVGRAGTERSDG